MFSTGTLVFRQGQLLAFPQEKIDAKSQENLAALVGCGIQGGGRCPFLGLKKGAQPHMTQSDWGPERAGA